MHVGCRAVLHEASDDVTGRGQEEARAIGMTVIGLLGRDGGALRSLCDVPIVVPSQVTARIQESHILIGHTLCGLIEEHLGLA